MIEARSAGQIPPLKITDETILIDINSAIASLVEKLEKPVSYYEAAMIENSLNILKNTRDYLAGQRIPVTEELSNAGPMNGKIRVVENTGCNSAEIFGSVGNILNVINGSLIDIDGWPWDDEEKGKFESIEQINEYFSSDDGLQTKFELVED